MFMCSRQLYMFVLVSFSLCICTFFQCLFKVMTVQLGSMSSIFFFLDKTPKDLDLSSESYRSATMSYIPDQPTPYTCAVVNSSTPPIDNPMCYAQLGSAFVSAAQAGDTQPDSAASAGAPLSRCFLCSGAAMLLTDGSVYADKEALSCQAGQLPRPPNLEPQHLSGWFAEEEEEEGESCGRASAPRDARLQPVLLSENGAIHSGTRVVCPRKAISPIRRRDACLKPFLTSALTTGI